MARQRQRVFAAARRSFLLVALLVSGWTGVPDPPVVKVEPVSEAAVTTLPGKVATIAFRVTNLDGVERQYADVISLPEGWRLVTSPTSFVVGPSAVAIRLIAVHIPDGVGAGDYSLTYTARDVENRYEFDQSTVVIGVGTIVDIEVEIVTSPRFMLAGQQGRLDGYVSNNGNAAVSIVLSPRVSAGLAVDGGEMGLEIPAQSNMTFSFSLNVAKDLQVHTNARIRLVASVPADPAVAASASTLVELFPTKRRDRRRDQPARLTFIGVGDERGTGGQISLTGGGPFARGNLDLEITAPDVQRTSFFGSRSVYRARYESDDIDVLLGDNVFALSPLTEMGLNGFGAGTRARFGRVEVKGFSHKVRYSFPDDQESALAASFETLPKVSIGANVLRRRGAYNGDIYSLRTSYEKDAFNLADLECGLDSNSGASPSCYLMLSGRRSNVSVNIHAVEARPEFPGYSRDLSSRSVGVVARTMPWMRVEGAWQHYDRGLDGGYGRGYNVVRVGTVLTGRRQKFPVNLFAYYQHRSLAYTGPGSTVNNSQDALRMRASYNWSRVGVSGGVEGGRTTGPAGTANFGRFEAEVRLFPKSVHRLAASVEYVSGSPDFSSDRQRRWLVNTDLNLRIGLRTRAGIHAFTSLDRGDRSHNYMFGRILFEHEFNNGHRVGLRAQHSRFVGATEYSATDFGVSYSVPIGIPGRPSSTHKVNGRVYDAETGEGVAGVPIYAGTEATITRSDGRFDLSLPSGVTTFLRMDRASAGMDRIPARKMPLEIPDVRKHESMINIPLTRAGRVFGSVTFGRADSPLPDHARDDTPTRFLLELANEEQKYRQMSDRDGSFAFEEVPPGSWKLSVVHARLPSALRLARESVPVEVAAGEEITVEFQIVRRDREVRMIDAGVIQLKRGRTSGDSLSGPTDVVASPTGADAAPGREAPRAGTTDGKSVIVHVVREGESLWRIAQRYLGRGALWQRVFHANREVIKNPDRIYPGWELTISLDGD